MDDTDSRQSVNAGIADHKSVSDRQVLTDIGRYGRVAAMNEAAKVLALLVTMEPPEIEINAVLRDYIRMTGWKPKPLTRWQRFKRWIRP